MNDIQAIANMLTDDPDILLEDMSGSMSNVGMQDKPLNSIDIDKQAQDIGGTEEASEIVADQLEVQQETEQQEAEQRHKMMEPQFKQLDDVMGKLQNSALQSQQATMVGNAQFDNLNKELASINTLVTGLQSQLR